MVPTNQFPLLLYFIQTGKPRDIDNKSSSSIITANPQPKPVKTDPEQPHSSILSTNANYWHLVSARSRKLKIMKENSASPLCPPRYGVLPLFEHISIDSSLPSTVPKKAEAIDLVQTCIPSCYHIYGCTCLGFNFFI